VGLPPSAQRHDGGRPFAPDAAHEVVTDGLSVSLQVKRRQRKPLRETGIRPRREHWEPKGFDLRGHPRPSDEGHNVAGGRCGPRDRNERFQVAAPAGEGKEQTHGQRVTE
jgi:hypothetical protein